MPTARAIITRAHRLLGVLPLGQAMEAEEAQDGLAVLNAMLAQWRLERLMVHTISRQVFPLTAGQGTYTLGPGGDWNAPRPVRIERASVQSSPEQETPLDLYTVQEWQHLAVKGTMSTVPEVLYIEYTHPLITAQVYPVPLAGGAETIVLYTWALLEQFANLSDDLGFPDGYEAAMWYNLAIWRAPDYERAVSAEIQGLALSSKARLKVINTTVPRFNLDPAIMR